MDVFVDAVATWKGKSVFGEILQTPNFDRICAESTAFHCAHCQVPVCGPSRASFMSGKSSHKTGVLNTEKNCFERIPPKSMWPYRLKQNGYFCSSGGKVATDPVALLDVGPTVMDYVDLPPLDECVAQSLRPFVVSDHRAPDRAVPTFIGENAAIRKGKYRFIRYRDGSTQLFDLEADWWQTRDLGSEHPDYEGMPAAYEVCFGEYGADPVAVGSPSPPDPVVGWGSTPPPGGAKERVGVNTYPTLTSFDTLATRSDSVLLLVHRFFSERNNNRHRV